MTPWLRATLEAHEAGLGSGSSVTSAMPALVRLALSRSEGIERLLGGPLARQTLLADPSLTVGMLASLGAPERVEVRRQLRLAGWKSAELEMLRLEEAQPGLSAEQPRSAGRRASAPTAGSADQVPAIGVAPGGEAGSPSGSVIARLAEGVALAAFERATALTRNLARVLTGTESLAAAGGARQGSVAVAAAAALPMLESLAEDRYFGALAPERAVGATFRGVESALAELVQLAGGELARGDSAVPASVAQAVIGRLERALQHAHRASKQAMEPDSGLAATGAGVLTTTAAERFAGALAGAPGAAASVDGAGPDGAGFDVPGTSGATARLDPLGLGLPVVDGPRPGYRVGFDGERAVLGLEASVVGLPLKTLGERVARALRQAEGGPAGAGRLVAGPARVGAAQAEGAGYGREPGPLASRAVDRPIQLATVLAPELMLSGADRAGYRAMLSRSAGDRTVVAGETAASQGRGAAAGGERAETVQGRRASQPGSRAGAARRGRGVGSTQASRSMAAGASSWAPERMASVVRWLDAAGGRALASDATLELTLAWLDRVDGSLAGVDLGMGGTRAAFRRALAHDGAAAAPSIAAADSPILDAGFVDMSLRPSGAHADGVAAGAARPRHAAAAAAQQVDFGRVETGSSASTAHADLGRMASHAVGSSQGAGRVPLPLVAPAVKAVAQSAHLHSSNEAVQTHDGGGDESASSGGGSGGSDGAKMSDAALKALAPEMADLVARLQQRDHERRGRWI